MTATCWTEPLKEFGHYALLEKLGEDCLGQVYRAIDRDGGRPVAVRIFDEGIRWDSAISERFNQHCQSLSSIHHPNIAELLEFGHEGQSAHIVTEFLEGTDLRSLVSRKPDIPAEKKLQTMIQVCEGLSHAHGKGLPHSDLKPANIHVAADGTTRIRDLGITQLLIRHLARPGVRWGSAIYLSPEQVGRNNCDFRSDIFSAGIILYELLTWSHPFHDPNSNKAVDNILFETEFPTIDRYPDLPAGLWTIIRTCIAKDPSQRYRSANELVDELRALLKSMAEECQLMLSELLAALPRLRIAANLPDAPQDTATLMRDVERLLIDRQCRHYASLERLMASLLRQYSTIQGVTSMYEVTEPCVIPDLTVESRGPAPVSSLEIPPSEPEPRRGEAPAVPVVDIPGPAAVPEIRESAAKEEPAPAKEAAAKTGETTSEAPLPTASMRPEIRPLDWNAGLEAVAVPPPRPYYRRIPRRALRTTAALMALLLIAVAAYIAFLPKIEPTLRSVLSAGKSGTPETSPAPRPQDRGSEVAAAQPSSEPPNIKTLLNEAETLAAQHRIEESKLFLQRILEINPAYAPALSLLRQIDAPAPGTSPGDTAKSDFRKELAGVSSLIVSGQLPSAKAALDRLQRSYPDAPGVLTLRRQWESANYKAAAELKRKEEAQQEEERLLRVTDLYARGSYDEARGALTLWAADDPSSAQAQRLKGQIEEIQRSLRAYDTALAEGKYQDALNALGRVQQLNASDPNLAGLREQLDRRISSARAVLTVHRLGTRGTLLLDGKPAGSDGEIENESVPIGSHTLAVADQRSVQVSRAVELREGQRIAYVYDLQKQLLRPMTEGDAELAARAKALEEVHRFAVEHTHGLFRGGCKGTLEISLFEVAYEPASGTHRFRIPFNRLKPSISGKSLDLAYVSDGKTFQSFRVEDPQAIEKLKGLWERLRALDQRVTNTTSAQADGSSRDSKR